MRRFAIIGLLTFTPAALAQSCGGLVGYWPFDDFTANDSSGLANHGTLYGAPAFGPGPSGMALMLDGADDFVSVANDPSLNPSPAMSVSAWYRPVSFSGSGNDSIIDKGNYGHYAPYYQYHLGVTGNQYPSAPGGFGFNIPYSGAGTPGGVWTPGNWYHLVGTTDGVVARFYLNGALINENPAPASIPDFGTPVYFGRFNNLEYYLPGAIDEIRIFDRALSGDEVTLLYDRPDGLPIILPADAASCPGSAVELRAVTLAPESATYQWRKDGLTLDGEAGATLVIASLDASFEGAYDCIITTSCTGAAISSPAQVRVCIGEFNCDGGVDGSDVDVFFAAWEGGQAAADVNADGGIDGSDVEAFFVKWEAGC